jgi:GNAT superfamily N-acetyltransferase
VIRPMREDDALAVFELMCDTFEEYARVHREPVPARPDPGLATIRHRHLVRTDPDGAWVAEVDGRIVGNALALRREDVWGLSLLIVHPDHQSRGLGGRLLERAHAYADGARGRIILSSADPRAIRGYARLGLACDPALCGSGRPRGVRAPSGVRTGTVDDVPFTAEVDRFVRGAAHGSDIEAMLAMKHRLLIAEQRGYAVFGGDGQVRLVAAYDEAAASDLLRAALARIEEATVEWLTARQQWAVRVCVEAGLELRTGHGAVFTDGDVGPFHPYLPNGAYL